MGMILDDSIIREIEVANNATDSKEEDYHLQIARWLKDYKRLLKQEPCEDAISRADVLDLCDSKDAEYKVKHFKEDVECLPSVYPKQNLDKIRAEIEQEYKLECEHSYGQGLRRAIEIIDKYKKESEE